MKTAKPETGAGHQNPPPPDSQNQNLPHRWPLAFVASPAAVAVWSGWVGLGTMAGFGIVHPLPGIADSFQLNTAITLPVGVEAYGAYALGVWLGRRDVPEAARRFARWSAIGALALGIGGQVAYHLLSAAHAARAPWWVTMLVACLPVVTLGFGAALTHLMRSGARENQNPVSGTIASSGTRRRTPAPGTAKPEPVLVSAPAPEPASRPAPNTNTDTNTDTSPAAGTGNQNQRPARNQNRSSGSATDAELIARARAVYAKQSAERGKPSTQEKVAMELGKGKLWANQNWPAITAPDGDAGTSDLAGAVSE
jgi:hypothetical protein